MKEINKYFKKPHIRFLMLAISFLMIGFWIGIEHYINAIIVSIGSLPMYIFFYEDIKNNL